MTSTDTAADSLTWTPLTLEDVPALTALLNRVDQADDLGEPAEEASTREWLTMPDRDLAGDSLAVRDRDELVAVSLADVHVSLDRDGRARCQLLGTVDPAYRRRGLGTALFEHGERRAAELAAARHPGVPAVYRTSGGRDPAAGSDPSAPRTGGADVRPLLERRGYRRVRSWLSMTRELPGAELPAVDAEGARISAPADTEREATRLAHLAAFADHWGSAPVGEERWNMMWSSHTARRELSTIAVDDEGAVLAYAIAMEDKPGVLHLALVGTRPAARGRGIARAVIARTLDAAARAGYSSAELEVDAESLTGATRLYDALGFTREHVYATFEKPVG
ncbi:GNAT family N-acetyltransferase [Brachybacterium sp. P6-10-X1]|uniref:GNAT family N-acetyltransferase n=1 Tax=Brachybacterium sp. P6-10-X1 TaxID=1903186 RepID=UPI000971A42A|nr:GNAT family N-acetyltransferase [Brachybacterium sp. P6-10-X1]APX34249.1 GNAT family N-acetyltransferase [Brachybacterium sp. P6-10-X1]